MESAQAYTGSGCGRIEITARRELAEGIVEMSVYAPWSPQRPASLSGCWRPPTVSRSR
ncbi:MAG: hypothetical protein R2734_07700 [Nocardioides sp.]